MNSTSNGKYGNLPYVSTNDAGSFNLTKFCLLAEDPQKGTTEAYRVTVSVVFTLIGLAILLANSIALFSVLKNPELYFKKDKVFILTLLTHDLFSGCTIVPLFIYELSHHPDNCLIRALRAMFFAYFMSCRIMGIFFISIQTYVKINHARTLLAQRFDRHSPVLNIVFVWTPGALFLLIVGFSDISDDKILRCAIFVPHVVIICCSIGSYLLVLRVINGANTRSRRISREEYSIIYLEASTYVKKLLVWFLLTYIPFCVSAFALLLFAFYPDIRRQHMMVVQQIYVVVLVVTSIDAIINPCLLVRREEDIKAYMKGIRNSCKRISIAITESFRMNDLNEFRELKDNDEADLEEFARQMLEDDSSENVEGKSKIKDSAQNTSPRSRNLTF